MTDYFTGDEIVEFGKYRGRRVAELAADRGYARWLMSQPWAADDYPLLVHYLREQANVRELIVEIYRI